MNFGTLLVAFNTEDFCQKGIFLRCDFHYPFPLKLTLKPTIVTIHKQVVQIKLTI
uniref:Uncharacterized protein n=1 Tax=Anguilla anguilla TaxID=7936 RepID=A0A0E9Y1G6_ANGAN